MNDKLRPWQIAQVENALHALALHQVFVDLSDTGTGKTYVACAVAAALRLPTLVVAPKIAISSWHRAAEHFNDTLSVTNYESLRTGNTPYGAWTNPRPEHHREDLEFTCQCCQQKINPDNPHPCYCHPQGVHCLVAMRIPWDYGNFRFAPEVKVVIFDEVHRCGAPNSLNADMLIAAKRDRKVVMGLSATAAISPLKMRALGYVLGLHTLTPKFGLGYYDWLRTVGCGKLSGLPGFRWTVGAARQRKVMERLHDYIIPNRGVRVRTSQIPNFPSRTIISEQYDIEHPDKIETLYAEMRESLARLQTSASGDAAPDSAITTILRVRQRLEILKVPLLVELCSDYIEKGCSVAIFASFSETIDALAARLNTDCVIDGRPGNNRAGVRDERVAAFQANRERAIILNSEAGGIAIGLQDLDGAHPRVGLVLPCYSAVTMRQIFGRLPRDGGKSHSVYRVIFAAGIVESGMAKALRAKSNNIDALNDADCNPDNFVIDKAPGR